MAANDPAAVFLGTYRMVHLDANDNAIAELLEKLAAEFGAVTVTSAVMTDPQTMPKVKKRKSTILREDDKLLIRIKAVGSEVIDVSHLKATVRVPVTFKNKRTGVVYEKTMKYADFTDLLVAGGDVAALAAKQWYDWITYTIPAQSEMKLGHELQDVRVDSALLLHLDTNTTDA